MALFWRLLVWVFQTPYLDQLAIGGRLIAPVSKSETEQQLLLIERVSSHRYQRTALDEVFFVPLQSGVI